MDREPPWLPEDPSDDELAQHWTLSEQDLVQVRQCRGEVQRHSFALQLCVLRRYGRFLGTDYTTVPLRILNHVGRQIGHPPVLFATPPARKETDATHERRLRTYLGFTTFDQAARESLEQWLGERAAEGVLADALIARAEQRLFTQKVVAPARSTLTRFVHAVTSSVEEVTLRGLFDRLPATLCQTIDALLVVPTDAAHSPLEDLREPPPEPTPEVINRFLRRADTLRGFALAAVDFRGLPGVTPDLVTHLADLASRYDVAHLRRFAPPKRYSLVACLLLSREKSLLDELVTMHHVYLQGLDRRARHAFAERYLRARHDLRTHLAALVALATAIRGADGGGTVEAFRKAHVDDDGLKTAIEGCEAVERLDARGLLDAQLARHAWLKQYLPAFLRLPFEGGPGTAPLLAAIRYAQAFHTAERRALGREAPVEFGTGAWAKALTRTTTATGPDARVWELALAFEVDAALRRGDLYLPRSREHVAFWNLVHSPTRWDQQRARSYEELALPPQAELALARVRSEFDAAAEALVRGLADNRFAAVRNGTLELHRRDALAVSPGVRALRLVIETHMPEVGIEEVLLAVDRCCHFTRALVPLGVRAPCVENLYPTLLAALLAHGTNLGLTQMAQAARIPLDALRHVACWFLRDETLRAANRILVDYHHRLGLAAVWGDGTFSSSDGQRFAVQEGSPVAAFYPRYFGYYDRALSLYTHTSDQFSVFAARAISCAPRESLYVLDGLLENDTLLAPRSHTTDTHGATEQLFALCYLLGISFLPRLADLSDVQLYRLDRARSHGVLDPLLRTVDTALIVEQWDPMVRVAASLRDRIAPAHIVVDRLASGTSDRLAKALTMLGRIVKTLHVLRYLHDATLRDRIHLQLNRGEARHTLAKRLFFGNQGVFRSGDLAEIMNKVSALSVLSNAVIVWNTARIAEIVQKLETSSGQPVVRADLAHVSPLLHSRILVSGQYHFERATPPDVADRGTPPSHPPVEETSTETAR